MKLFDAVKSSAPKCGEARAAKEPTTAASGGNYLISGYGPEDTWETFAHAKYRAKTGAGGFAKRLYGSEPDLVLRRSPVFVTERRHRRCMTMPARDSQPWVRTVRETQSCPIAPLQDAISVN